MVTHSRDAAAAAAAAHEISAAGFVSGDLGAPSVCRQVVRDACDLLGGLDLLVCNAASFVRARPGEITPEAWAEAMDISARAPLLMMQEAWGDLRESRGSVVLISDRSAVEHWPAYAAHAAAKAALESLTVSCARAWEHEVRVNAIRPGTILPPDDWDEHRTRTAQLRDDWQPLELALRAVATCATDTSMSGVIIDLADTPS